MFFGQHNKLNTSNILPAIDKSETLYKKIPKTIYFIWFGSILSKENFPDYLKNIALWKKINPEYDVQLWMENKEVVEKQIEQLPDDHQINIFDINSHKEQFENHSLINKYLDEKNFWAASDVARVDLLTNGGAYFDVKIKPEKRLNEILANKSVNNKDVWIGDFYLEHDNTIYGVYSAQIATKNHPVYLKAQNLMPCICDEFYNNFEKPYVKNKEKSPWLTHEIAKCKTGFTVFFARDILCNNTHNPQTIDFVKISINDFGSFPNTNLNRKQNTQDAYLIPYLNLGFLKVFEKVRNYDDFMASSSKNNSHSEQARMKPTTNMEPTIQMPDFRIF